MFRHRRFRNWPILLGRLGALENVLRDRCTASSGSVAISSGSGPASEFLPPADRLYRENVVSVIDFRWYLAKFGLFREDAVRRCVEAGWFRERDRDGRRRDGGLRPRPWPTPNGYRSPRADRFVDLADYLTPRMMQFAQTVYHSSGDPERTGRGNLGSGER